MATPFIGQISLFAGNFAPRGWALCNGQILAIAQNTALFSILGTTYGGNGQTTFALPDLRGRVPLHAGAGPGLTLRDLGEVSGSETVTLLATQMPAHSHTLAGSTTVGTTQSPAAAFIAEEAAGTVVAKGFSTSSNATLAASSIGSAGGNQPHNNMPPYLGLNYIIALQGIFPSRN